MSRYTSATDADRREMLDAIGVELDRRAVRRRAGGRAARPPAGPPAGQARAGGLHAAARPRRPQRLDRGRDLVPRRRDVRPLRPEPDRLDPVPLGVPDALHALPARDLPGRAAGDVRVPDRDLRADGPAGLQRERLRGSERARRRRLPREAAQQAHALPDLRRRAPACARDARDDRRRLGHDRRGDPARRRRHAGRRSSATTSPPCSCSTRTSSARSRTSRRSPTPPTRPAR